MFVLRFFMYWVYIVSKLGSTNQFRILGVDDFRTIETHAA